MTDKIMHIRVHPVVKKYIESRNDKSKHGIVIKDKKLKEEIICYASIRTKKLPSKISKGFEQYKQIDILVNNWTFFQYGFDIAPYWQDRLSRKIYTQILDEIAARIEAYAAVGRSRIEAIDDYYEKNNITYDELNPSTVIKHYQRHHQTNKQ
jgi:ATP-dependent RNA circularization protein (DNA/RNA ligase family)